MDDKYSHYFYQKKLLSLVIHLASGMNRKEVWTGQESLNALQFHELKNQLIRDSNLISDPKKNASIPYPDSLEIKLKLNASEKSENK